MGDGDELEIADWKKRESFASVAVQIVIVAALLAGAVFLAWSRGVDREASTAAIEKARGQIRMDGRSELRAAVETLKPALDSTVRGADAHAVAARALAELAVVHMEPAALEPARQHLSKATDSEVEELASAQALVQLADGKVDQAINRLEALATQGPRRLDVEYVLARAYVVAGRTDRALETLERASTVAAREPRIHTLRGDLLLVTGEEDAALASYRRALASNAQHAAARLGVALAQARRSGDVTDLDRTVAALEAEGLLEPALAQRATALRPATAIAADAVP